MHPLVSPTLLLLSLLPHIHLAHSLPSNSLIGIDDLLDTRGGAPLGLSNISVSQICGTKNPTPALREIHNELRLDPLTLPRLIGRSPPRPFARRSLEERAANPKIVVELYIHWVTTFDQARYYSSTLRAKVIQNQISAMNNAYGPSNIIFHHNTGGSSYTIRDDWATDANSTLMKQNLRRGTYSSLNIYFQSNLSSSGNGQVSTLLGYCSLPTVITYGDPPTEYPAVDYATDGCNVLTGSMPGAPNAVYGYNEGKTAVHEVGHWFGLLHTFQDNTCTPGDPGDYVDDTPQESTATSGCPTGKDSCLADKGIDPIHNYMDYSTDQCYTQFSANQASRMASMWSLYREGY